METLKVLEKDSVCEEITARGEKLKKTERQMLAGHGQEQEFSSDVSRGEKDKR